MPLHTHHPPKAAKKMLHWFLRPELVEEVEGDLEERFYDKLVEHLQGKARLLVPGHPLPTGLCAQKKLFF
jgi:hypothetical protein